jgi:hypothetical protein
MFYPGRGEFLIKKKERKRIFTTRKSPELLFCALPSQDWEGRRLVEIRLPAWLGGRKQRRGGSKEGEEAKKGRK